MSVHVCSLRAEETNRWFSEARRVTPIFHFTHLANLPKILDAGALLCDRLCREADLTVRDIAYSDLKRKRAETDVEVAPWGTLAHYVPFYFGTRSPMLYVYKEGYVTGKREDQDEIVYFAAYAEDVLEAGLPFAFTDGHPIREPKAFFNDLADLVNVDLPLMTERMWRDTDDDPDKKRRRQAEFLVHERVELSILRGIATRNSGVQAAVLEILETYSVNMPYAVRPGWYY